MAFRATDGNVRAGEWEIGNIMIELRRLPGDCGVTLGACVTIVPAFVIRIVRIRIILLMA